MISILSYPLLLDASFFKFIIAAARDQVADGSGIKLPVAPIAEGHLAVDAAQVNTSITLLFNCPNSITAHIATVGFLIKYRGAVVPNLDFTKATTF